MSSNRLARESKRFAILENSTMSVSIVCWCFVSTTLMTSRTFGPLLAAGEGRSCLSACTKPTWQWVREHQQRAHQGRATNTCTHTTTHNHHSNVQDVPLFITV